VNSATQALAKRIKELRRRHYGARGAAECARRLGVSSEDYARFERGAIPPPDVLVRMCELTGEDLQWLLTGVASRGTVVISGTRTRHQELLTNLARLLDETPGLAAPVEAFVDLLTRSRRVEAEPLRQLPEPPPWPLIPIFQPDELPLRLPASAGARLGDAFPLVPTLVAAHVTLRERRALVEPAGKYDPASAWPVDVLTLQVGPETVRQCIDRATMAQSFPGMFGVRLADETMAPMFCGGDVALVRIGTGPRERFPALCRLTGEAGVRCRLWLGADEQHVSLGRSCDGAIERVERAVVCWSLEVLYRLAA